MGWALKFSSGMHWIKLGLEVLKHAWKSFPLLMRTDVWGQHLLALGPSRDIPSSFARDGDSIPFSMIVFASPWLMFLNFVIRHGNLENELRI